MCPTITEPDEPDYVDECPVCETDFIGVSFEEFRETHAHEECPKAPLTALIHFREQ